MASLIRDRPFSGDTSDSDDECASEERTANNLPVKDVSLRSSTSSISGVGPLKTCAPYTAQNMKNVRFILLYYKACTVSKCELLFHFFFFIVGNFGKSRISD